MAAAIDHPTPTVRGEVAIDVHAIDDSTIPPTKLLVECKHWSRPVPQTIVHAFRTVVVDTGANQGIVVSSQGFQRGAHVTSEFTNLKLVDWSEFETLFERRWFERWMMPTLQRIAEPLLEYTEPVNSRVFRRADAMPREGRKRFVELRDRHMLLGFGLFTAVMPSLGMPATIPQLPLKNALAQVPKGLGTLPEDILNAPGLRPLMGTLVEHFQAAIAEFDDLFGGRA